MASRLKEGRFSIGEVTAGVFIVGTVSFILLQGAVREIQAAPGKVKDELETRITELKQELKEKASGLDGRTRTLENRVAEVAGDARSASEKAARAAESADKAVEGIQSLRELIIQQQQQQPRPYNYPPPRPRAEDDDQRRRK